MTRQVKLPQPVHLPALDGLRGVAILLVLPHNLRRITEPFDAVSLAWVKLGDTGWIGVQLFFVLSGFLITRILLNTQEASNYFSGFYARRVLRIMPLYYATMLVWLAVLLTFHLGVQPGRIFDLSQWLFLSNWTQPFFTTGNGLSHFWSLAVEEQFYLLWPLAIWRLSAAGALRLCGAVAALSFAIRVAMVATGWPTETVYEFTVCRMDALAMGGAVAAAMAMPALRQSMLRRTAWIRLSPLVVFLAGAAVSRGYRQTGAMAQTLGYSLLAAAFALWVLSIALGSAPGQAPLRTRFLRAAGKYSYALYVLHLPLKIVWEKLLPSMGFTAVTSVAGDILAVALSGAAVFALATASYRFLEAPALRLKTRFEPVLSTAGR